MGRTRMFSRVLPTFRGRTHHLHTTQTEQAAWHGPVQVTPTNVGLLEVLKPLKDCDKSRALAALSPLFQSLKYMLGAQGALTLSSMTHNGIPCMRIPVSRSIDGHVLRLCQRPSSRAGKFLDRQHDYVSVGA
jgi:hypothetical protein